MTEKIKNFCQKPNAGWQKSLTSSYTRSSFFCKEGWRSRALPLAPKEPLRYSHTLRAVRDAPIEAYRKGQLGQHHQLTSVLLFCGNEPLSPPAPHSSSYPMDCSPDYLLKSFRKVSVLVLGKKKVEWVPHPWAKNGILWFFVGRLEHLPVRTSSSIHFWVSPRLFRNNVPTFNFLTFQRGGWHPSTWDKWRNPCCLPG